MGVPIVRIMIYFGVYIRVPLFRDNYHVGSTDLNHMIFPSTETLLGTIYIVKDPLGR